MFFDRAIYGVLMGAIILTGCIAPVERMDPLPEVSPRFITLSIDGSDALDESGLASVTYFVSEDGGPFAPRITTSIKVGTRTDRDQSMQEKINSVTELDSLSCGKTV